MYVGFVFVCARRGGMENGSAFQQQSDPVGLASSGQWMGRRGSSWNGGNARMRNGRARFRRFRDHGRSEVAWRESKLKRRARPPNITGPERDHSSDHRRDATIEHPASPAVRQHILVLVAYTSDCAGRQATQRGLLAGMIIVA